jgi:alpha-tubulin suppressor-like RCC1 family protein
VGLAAGQFHNLALKKDGVVVAWGGNFDGQTTIPSGLSNVVAIAAGGHHSLALKEGGTVAGGGTIRLDKRRLPKD